MDWPMNGTTECRKQTINVHVLMEAPFNLKQQLLHGVSGECRRQVALARKSDIRKYHDLKQLAIYSSRGSSFLKLPCHDAG